MRFFLHYYVRYPGGKFKEYLSGNIVWKHPIVSLNHRPRPVVTRLMFGSNSILYPDQNRDQNGAWSLRWKLKLVECSIQEIGARRNRDLVLGDGKNLVLRDVFRWYSDGKWLVSNGKMLESLLSLLFKRKSPLRSDIQNGLKITIGAIILIWNTERL